MKLNPVALGDGLKCRSDFIIAPAPHPPGSVLSAPGDATAAAPGAVRGTFTLLRAQVLEMDWLSLDPDGHRRAVFDYRDAAPAARWLVP